MKNFAFAFIFMLAVGFTVNAQDCEQAGLTMDAVRVCLYDKLDKNLNSAYKPLYQSLSTRNRPAAAALLKKSQITWRRFVEDSCAFTAEMNFKEMIREDARLNCWSEFTSARIKVLKDWAAQYQRMP
ncbi:MAG TPA: lysozyme inhibitor LprI family protein [Pyrinomonadaceae bacterium]